MKKVIALLLVCLQFTGMVVTAHGEETALPFFQETLLPLPEGYVWRGMDVVPGGSLLVLGKHNDGTYAFMRWQETEGMPELITLPDYGVPLNAMKVAADGEIMLSTLPRKRGVSEVGTISGTIIWVKPTGEEISRFSIESDAVIPIIKALPGRRVAIASSLNPLDLMVYEDQGNVLYSMPQMLVDSLLFNEEVLYVFCKGFVLALSADTGERIDRYPIESNYSGYANIGQNGELYCTRRDGIYEINLTDGKVEKRMDSLVTSFGGQNAFLWESIVLPSGAFTVAIGDAIAANQPENIVDDSVFIAIYSKPLENTLSRTPFTITRMNDNFYSIEEAASIFQRRHPELDVQLRTFRTWADGGLTKEDASRVVITELLARGGGDVIVLDYLPADAMMKRGMLRDIAHLVPKLSLVPGIADSLQYADGKVYAIPAYFSIPLLMGSKETISDIQTFADILDAPIESYQARIDCSDYTIKEIFKMCMGDFLDDQGQMDFLSPDFVSFLEILQELYTEAETAPTTGANAMVAATMFNMISMISIYTDFGEESYILTMPTMHGMSRGYVPEIQLGIPTSAKNLELSEEFICLAISEEMGLDISQSFSTVPSLLDRLFEEMIEENKGKSSMRLLGTSLQFAVPSEEYLMRLHTLLGEVTESLPIVDDQVLEFIIEELHTLFEGIITAEETAERINQRAFLYLNE